MTLAARTGKPQSLAPGVSNRCRDAAPAVTPAWPVALSCDVVYLQHQFHANGRPPPGRGRRKWPRSGPDMDRTTRQRDIRIPPAALIFRDAEA